MITTRQDKVQKQIKRLQERLDNLETLRPKYEKKYGDKAEWCLDCDRFSLQDQLEQCQYKLKDAIRLDNKENAKILKEEELKKLNDSMPQILKDYQQSLFEDLKISWIERNNRLRKMELPKDKNSTLFYEILKARTTTDNEIIKDAQRTSKRLVENLYNRVKDKIGIIKDLENLHLTTGNSNEYTCINGYIVGDKGTVEVRSVYSGGYNIQRLHVRVLVHVC